MRELSNVVLYPPVEPSVWTLVNQQECFDARRDGSTQDVYLRTLRRFTAWMEKLAGQSAHFVPCQPTTTSVQGYPSFLKEQGYRVSRRTRLKTVLNGFCQWLLEEKHALTSHPTRKEH